MQIPHTVEPRPDTGLYNAKLGIWLFLASEVMLFGGLFSAYIFLRLGAEIWPWHILNVPLGLTNTFILITSSITMVLAWASLKFREYGRFKLWLGITLLCGIAFLGIKSLEYAEKFKHYGFILHSDAAEKYRPELEKLGAKFTVGEESGEMEITGHFAEPYSEGETHFTIAPDPATSGHGAGSHEAHDTDQGEGEARADKGGAESHGIIRVAKDDVRWWSNFQPKYSAYMAIYFTLTGLHALHVIGGMVVLAYFWLTQRRLYLNDPEHLANRVEVGGLFWHFVDLVWIFLFPVLYLL